MTIIKLDSRAIEVLFPEGSEQRVELQKCVIAEFAKKAWSGRSGIPVGEINTVVNTAISNHVNSINQKLDEAFRNTQTEKLKGLGYITEQTNGSSWNRTVRSVHLSQSVVSLIEAEAKSAVNGQIKSEIQSAMETAVTNIVNSTAVQGRIDAAVKAALNSEVIKQVQQALLKQGTNND